MRFMLLMLPGPYDNLDLDPAAVEKMMAFNQSMVDAGVLRAAEGLHPPTQARRVTFETGKAVVHDGPFAETKEVLGGFWIIEVGSEAEAVAWATKCPGQPNETIEIRRIQELEDFTPEVQALAEGFEADSGWSPEGVRR
ncbi:MAG: YciI family protein [Pseudomonadota bacterium]